MTDTDIVTRLAREAGFMTGEDALDMTAWTEQPSDIAVGEFPVGRALTKFAALVASECARIIEAQDVDPAFKGRIAWAVRDRFKA